MDRRRNSLHIPGVGDIQLTDIQLNALGGQAVDEALDDPEIKILDMIARDGPYDSLITLATDLSMGYEARALLALVLQDLNEQGWITYHLESIADFDQNRAITREIPTRIRATREGFEKLGIRRPIRIAHDPIHRYGYVRPMGEWRDLTRYYHHPFHAIGGQIEREPIAIHLIRFPRHIHNLDGVPKMYLTKGEPMPSLRQEIVNSLYEETAPCTSNQVLDKVLLTFPTDIHNLVHQIWSLQKSGEVQFSERKNSDGKGDLVNITLTPFGVAQAKRLRGIPVESEWDRPFIAITMEELNDALEIKPLHDMPGWAGHKKSVRHPVGKDMTDPSQHGSKAQGGPVTREKIEVVPEIFDAQKYPMISALLERETKALQAATLLEEAGMKELSEMTLASITYTDFEKEVVSLVRRLVK